MGSRELWEPQQNRDLKVSKKEMGALWGLSVVVLPELWE
jgi:hypothetical protein